MYCEILSTLPSLVLTLDDILNAEREVRVAFNPS